MTACGQCVSTRRGAAATAGVWLSALVMAAHALAQATQGRPQGPYLGQTPPGAVPEVFAPGFVSSEGHEFACSFTPDGREFYFTRRASLQSRTLVMVTRMVNGTWSVPEPASFNDPAARLTFEPLVTPDGRRLYFSSDKPLEGGAAQGGPPTMNTWYVEREGDGWSEPRNPGAPFNPMRSMFSTMTAAGVIYTTDISPGMGNERIGVARPEGGAYRYIERLGPPVNAGAGSLYPYVAPDERYLLFTRRQGGPGSPTDLYVSFRGPDGSWDEPRPVPLGMPAGAATVSPDGRFLFFSGGERGRGDIYWVSAEVLRAGAR